MREAETVFIAVGTPSRRGDGHADLTYVFNAAREDRGRHRRLVVVTKSTVPVAPATGQAHHPGNAAGRRIRRRLQSRIPARGRGDRRFKRPDRIVIDFEPIRPASRWKSTGRALSQIQPPIVFTSRRTSN